MFWNRLCHRNVLSEQIFGEKISIKIKILRPYSSLFIFRGTYSFGTQKKTWIFKKIWVFMKIECFKVTKLWFPWEPLILFSLFLCCAVASIWGSLELWRPCIFLWVGHLGSSVCYPARVSEHLRFFQPSRIPIVAELVLYLFCSGWLEILPIFVLVFIDSFFCFHWHQCWSSDP